MQKKKNRSFFAYLIPSIYIIWSLLVLPFLSLSLLLFFSSLTALRSPPPLRPPRPPPHFHRHDFHSTAELSTDAASQRRTPCLPAGLRSNPTPKALFHFLQDPADFFAWYFLVVPQIQIRVVNARFHR